MSTLFPTGRLVITSRADKELDIRDVIHALRRHVRGDWGTLCEEDWAENDSALQHGTRLLSAYADLQGTVFWIITEADRSSTTVLLPHDY